MRVILKANIIVIKFIIGINVKFNCSLLSTINYQLSTHLLFYCQHINVRRDGTDHLYGKRLYGEIHINNKKNKYVMVSNSQFCISSAVMGFLYSTEVGKTLKRRKEGIFY